MNLMYKIAYLLVIIYKYNTNIFNLKFFILFIIFIFFVRGGLGRVGKLCGVKIGIKGHQ